MLHRFEGSLACLASVSGVIVSVIGQEYTDADNKRQRPIMIHRAVFGSIERFFGILIENYAGAFPLWMAPVQVRISAWRTCHFAGNSCMASHKFGNHIREANWLCKTASQS